MVNNEQEQQETQNLKKKNSQELKGSPKTPKFPLYSPTTPNFTPTPNQLIFSPEEEDFGSVLDNLLKKKQTASDDLFEKVLDQKNNELEDQEKEIKRLEAEKAEWLIEKERWEQERIEHHQLRIQLDKKEQHISHLTSELKESNDDYYELGLEKDQLSKSLKQEQLNKRELTQQLNQSREENYWLRVNHRQTKNDLLAKIEELTKLKKVEKAEKEEWQRIILEQVGS